MSKGKIAIIAIVCIIAVGCLGLGIWFLSIRIPSKKYNLVEIKDIDLPARQEEVESGYVQLTDVNMHYKKYGTTGRALIMIHGNGGSCESLSSLASYLANRYQVYCIDSRCQGHSSDPGVITYELMAKDVYEFIQKKGLEKPYVMGHSDGGMVTLALAANYPDCPKACVSCGSNSNPKKFKPYFTIGVFFNNLKQHSILNDLMLNEPDFTREYLGRITAPTLVVAAEFDIMPLSDSVFIHESIAGSEIAIVKNGNHGSYFASDDMQAYALARDFFAKFD